MKRIVGINGLMGSGKDTAASHLVKTYGFTRVAIADPIKRYAYSVFRFTEDQLWDDLTAKNRHDKRFQSFTDSFTGDDAWMAVFRRAEKHNEKLVVDLFEDVEQRVEALQSLNEWLLSLARRHTKLEPRIVYQTLGNSWGRGISEDVWIDHFLRTSDKLLGGGYRYDRLLGLVKEEGVQTPGVVVPDLRYKNEIFEVKARGFTVRIKRPGSSKGGLINHLSETEQLEVPDDVFNLVIVNDSSIKKLCEDIEVAGIIALGGEDKR